MLLPLKTRGSRAFLAAPAQSKVCETLSRNKGQNCAAGKGQDTLKALELMGILGCACTVLSLKILLRRNTV